MRAGLNDGPRNHPRQLISTNSGVVGGGYGVRISLGYFIYRTGTSSIIYFKKTRKLKGSICFLASILHKNVLLIICVIWFTLT